MKLLLQSLLAIGFVVLPLSWAQSASLLTYEFTDNTMNPTSVVAHTSATGIARSNSNLFIQVSSVASPPSAPYLDTLYGTGATVYTTASGAAAAGNYFSFTLTADSGFTLNLTSLSFDAFRGGSSTPRGFALQTSATGFSTDSSTNINLTGQVASGNSFDIPTIRGTATPYAFDLSGSTYQNLQSITFRFFVYAPAINNSVDFDSFNLAGSVVPEPSVCGLALLAGGLLLLRRRRK